MPRVVPAASGAHWCSVPCFRSTMDAVNGVANSTQASPAASESTTQDVISGIGDSTQASLEAAKNAAQVSNIGFINGIASFTQASLGVSENTAQVITWVAVIFAGYFLLQILRPLIKGFAKGKLSKGDLLLILGQCGAGKTALFFRLRDNEEVQTVSSLKPLRDTVNVQAEEQEEFPKPIEMVDCPGHQRLRGRAAELLKQARAIIYMVDAQDKMKLKDVAEHLYELMTSKELNDLHIPLLLACNKTDVSTARSEKFILEEIDREIERMRISRGASLQGEDAADSYLGVDGEKFKLMEHAPCPIETCSISVKTPKLGPLFDFLRAHFA